MEENEATEEEIKETENPEKPKDEDDISWEDAGFPSPEESTEQVDPADIDEILDSGSEGPSLPKFTDLKKDPSKIRPDNLDFILDIPLEVTAELGRTKMMINDLLQLGQGSIIELSKLAGEPLEILVNGRLIARGEVVVVNDKFGIRLTDIISTTERIEQLG